MSLQDTITRRLTDLATDLAKLDAQYQAERTIILKKQALLNQAQKAVTPEIQTLLDGLGLSVV